eukprot:scaffold154624_cov33-Tisochrysis_lutea.AAC.1
MWHDSPLAGRLGLGSPCALLYHVSCVCVLYRCCLRGGLCVQIRGQGPLTPLSTLMMERVAASSCRIRESLALAVLLLALAHKPQTIVIV